MRDYHNVMISAAGHFGDMLCFSNNEEQMKFATVRYDTCAKTNKFVFKMATNNK